MRLQRILFGSLFLSAAFVACTNEDFLEAEGPNVPKKAISLGENFTISGGFAQADTKAIYELEGTSIKSKWEPEDQVGGAWYAAYTAAETGFLFGSSHDQFASNHPYSRVNKEGNVATAQFQTNTNAFAGKYVLYFPFNANVAATAGAIPVTIETNQTMDLANPLAHISKKENYFAYTNAEYTVGGAQANDFELKPVPVLFALKFKANATTADLMGKTISKVVIEESGNYFYSKGEVKVSAASTTDYKNAKAKYSGVTQADAISLDITGVDENGEYIVKEGTGMEKPFYLVALPMSASTTQLTFTVITEDGMLFSRKNVALTESLKAQVKAEGGVFNATITLNEVGTATDKVYTVAQFESAWKEAVKSGTATIELGAPLSIGALELDKTAGEIKISGKALTVGTLKVTDGKLTINELNATDVTVGTYGELTTTKAKVTGNVEVNNVATLGGVEGLGSLTAGRGSVVEVTGTGADKEIAGDFSTAYDSKVTLKDIKVKGASAVAGELIVAAGGTVEFAGETTVDATGSVKGTATAAKLVFSGKLTNNGTVNNTDITALEINVLDNRSSVVIAGNATFKGSVTNGAEATVNATSGTVAFDGEVTNAGTFTVAGATVSFNEAVTNSAGITATSGSVTFKDLTNNENAGIKVGATVKLNGATVNSGVIDQTAGTLTNNGTLTNKGDITGTLLTNAASATLNLTAAAEAAITNNGTMNVTCEDNTTANELANLSVTNNNILVVKLRSAQKQVTFKSYKNGAKSKMTVSKGIAIVPAATVVVTGAEVVIENSGVFAFATQSTRDQGGTFIVSRNASEAILKLNSGKKATIATYYSSTLPEGVNLVIVEKAGEVTLDANHSYILRNDIVLTNDVTLGADKTIKVEGDILMTGKDAVKTITLSANDQIVISNPNLLRLGENAKISKNSNTLTDEGRIVTVGGTID